MLVELTMVVAALGFGVYAVLAWRKQGLPVRRMLGFSGERAGRDFCAGLVITTLAMVGIFGAELALGAISTGPSAPATVPQFLDLALGKLAHVFREEFAFRSLLLSGLLLALRGRVVLTIALSGIAFGLIHLSNPGATALSVTSNALGGMTYGIAFVLAQNLWLPIGLHFAWNFVQGPLLGFPVSGLSAGGLQQVHDHGPAWLTGGAYGPEGGVVGVLFRFAVIALVLLWVRSGWRQPAREAVALP
jgi:membrane protease YdiL (CAAX protease family)